MSSSRHQAYHPPLVPPTPGLPSPSAHIIHPAPAPYHSPSIPPRPRILSLNPTDYLAQSPHAGSFTSPTGPTFERAPTPGLKSFSPPPPSPSSHFQPPHSPIRPRSPFHSDPDSRQVVQNDSQTVKPKKKKKRPLDHKANPEKHKPLNPGGPAALKGPIEDGDKIDAHDGSHSVHQDVPVERKAKSACIKLKRSLQGHPEARELEPTPRAGIKPSDSTSMLSPHAGHAAPVTDVSAEGRSAGHSPSELSTLPAPVEGNSIAGLSFKRRKDAPKRDKPIVTPPRTTKLRSPLAEPPTKRAKVTERELNNGSRSPKSTRPSPLPEPAEPPQTKRADPPTPEHATPTASKQPTQKRPSTMPHATSGSNKTRAPTKKPATKIPPKRPVESSTSTSTKAGEYDLNDPTLWGALFGNGDKKPAVKPVKPGNLPARALPYNGTSIDRLTARAKQRAEEKKILQQQARAGFDLLRPNLDMMEFEIEYKNHVRAMVERPLGPEYTLGPSTEPVGGANPPFSACPPPGFAPMGLSGPPVHHPPANGFVPDTTGVIMRPDGYKRYIHPPAQTQPGHQPPGPIYQGTTGPIERRKVLPRPGMYASSFYIWQPAHIL